MFFMKVTRRMVDPITFVERVSVECIPRLEDTFLDEELGRSMSYYPPKRTSPASLEVQRQAVTSEFRPPTPPRERGQANSPRDPSLSPSAKRKLIKLAESSTRTTHTKKPNINALPFLSQIEENKEIGEGSMTNLSVQLKTSLLIEQVPESATKCVRFADENDFNLISPLRNSVIAEIFWGSDDLANFRYEAFMEKAGLDMNEFD